MKTKHPVTAKAEAEMETIGQIADRAVKLYASHDILVHRTDVLLDVMATHQRICKLRLHDLLAADDFNFAHDIGGINRHLDRDNYALTDAFRPRFAQ